MSQTTKKALAASLKKLLEKQPLSKITVTDITEDCEVNRHTFYYHFQDVYDLIDWIYENEAIKPLDGKNNAETWQQGFLQIFDYVRDNRAFVLNTYRSLSKDHLLRYLYRETYRLLLGVVEERAQGMRVSENHKRFIANFYKYGFVGLMVDWIEGGMKEEPEQIVSTLTTMIQGDFSVALERFRADCD